MGNLLKLESLLSDSSSGGAGIPFPSDGLLLWLDPSSSSSYTLDGSNRITEIHDLSGRGNNATSPVQGGFFGPTIGAQQLNGKDVMSFNGSDQFLACNNQDLLDIDDTETTVFCLMLSNLSQSQEALVSWHTNLGGNRRILQHDSNGAVSVTTSAQSNAPVAGAGQYTGSTTVVATYEISYVTNPRYYKNSVASPVAGGPLLSNTNTANLFSIGQEFDGGPTPSNLLDGYLGDILVYNRLLPQTDRESVEAYLINKWGL